MLIRAAQFGVFIQILSSTTVLHQSSGHRNFCDSRVVSFAYQAAPPLNHIVHTSTGTYMTPERSKSTLILDLIVAGKSLWGKGQISVPSRLNYAMFTNHNHFVCLPGLFEILLCLFVPAYPSRTPQTCSKIIRTFEGNCGGLNQMTFTKDEGPSLTLPTTPLPCYSSPGLSLKCLGILLPPLGRVFLGEYLPRLFQHYEEWSCQLASPWGH